jgi:acyl-CoA synthetase (AMP-forming)/AMP-acid ligase II
MTDAWVSTGGTVLRDLVPAALRREWVARGYCPDRDLFTLFSAHARAMPGRPAVIDATGVVDYATLDTHARGIAAALAEAGFGSRDIIGIQVPNDRRAVAAELAVAAIGAVALPFPVGHGRRDTFQLLGRARADAAIVAGTRHGVSLAEELATLRSRLPYLRAVFVFGVAGAGERSLDPWLGGAARHWYGEPVDPEAPARILASSGTEATPKMVAYSHNAMAGGRANYIGALHTGPGPMRNLVLVPLSSSFGSCGTSITIATYGGTLLLRYGFEPTAVLRMIGEYRPTHLFAVPTMLGRLATHPPDPDEDLSALRTVVSSGAALHPATLAECSARLARPIVNVYGSADGVNCHTAGRRLPTGRPGEICALGPMTPLCYVNDPELDARYRLPGGWVRTGDLGVLDGDGILHVVDRLKQVVIRGGYTISPAEIEQELREHAAVADVACVGVPDADLGERLCAFVVPRRAVTLDELNRFLAADRAVARGKLPESLYTVDELPLGPTGKVCRRTLSRLAADRSGRASSPAGPENAVQVRDVRASS